MVEEIKIKNATDEEILNYLYMVYLMGFINCFALFFGLIAFKYGYYFFTFFGFIIVLITLPPTKTQLKERSKLFRK